MVALPYQLLEAICYSLLQEVEWHCLNMLAEIELRPALMLSNSRVNSTVLLTC